MNKLKLIKKAVDEYDRDGDMEDCELIDTIKDILTECSQENPKKKFVYPEGHCWEGLTPEEVEEGYKNRKDCSENPKEKKGVDFHKIHKEIHQLDKEIDEETEMRADLKRKELRRE